MTSLRLITALLFIFASFAPLVDASAHGRGPCVCKVDDDGCGGTEACALTCPHHGEEGRDGRDPHEDGGHGAGHGEGVMADGQGGGGEAGRGSGTEELRKGAGTHGADYDASGQAFRCGCRGQGANPTAQIDQPFMTAGADWPSHELPSFSAPFAGPVYTGPAPAVPDRPPSSGPIL